MAKGEKRLVAKQVAGELVHGVYADGAGLTLVVDKRGQRWIWRYRFAGKRREMGLGALADVTLAQARAERERWAALIREGRDPIEARKKAREPEAGGKTFGEVADAYLEGREESWRNPKHAAQWKMSLEKLAAPLRDKPVEAISTADVLGVLKPLWVKTPETASRLRGRIEAVLNAARALGHIDESRANPARWRGHLDQLLVARSHRDREHYAAMPFAEVPAFVQRLRELDYVSARALEFAILTAARSGEVRGARLAEVDLAKAIWTRPKERMKAGVEHRVPLSPRALEIVVELKTKRAGSKYLFPGTGTDKMLSDMTLTKLLRRQKLPYTPHGFRSSFRDWVGDATTFPRDLAELALAHTIEDKSEAAYRRGDGLERRRKLMLAWERYVSGAGGANVIPLRA